MVTKRALPAKVAAMKARKRQKLGTGDVAPAKKIKFAVESLKWKSVSLPDRLDDYEGFFGLEEVEDVDVVRDDTTGQVSFVAKAVDEPSQPEPQRDAQFEEWSGFDDDISLTQDIELSGRRAVRPTKAKNAAPDKTTFTDLADEDEGADISAWRSLKLSTDTLAAVSKLNFASPTTIQSAAIPEILSGHDVIGKASTGSGKTLAFGIPILEEFLDGKRTPQASREKSPIALVLSPTRELAHQLDKHLTALCRSADLSIATLTGGLSLQKQQRLLKHADIVIGTPGRLWEVMSSGQGIAKALQKIQFLVVDEADRLLSEGHFKEVEDILNALDRTEVDDDDEKAIVEPAVGSKRQTLIFSATFDKGLQRKLASRSYSANANTGSLEYLLAKIPFKSPTGEKPKFVDANPVNQLANGLKEGLIECAGTEKDLYLYTLLLLHPNTRTLVFCNSISAVRRLQPLLQNLNLDSHPLHSGMPQKSRLRSLERFTSDKNNSAAHQQKSQTGSANSNILLATDVAARGLDIPHVDVVIHYHLPRTADAYVHRSGRTARAGLSGKSIIICSPEEAAGVRRLVAKVHATTTVDKKQGYLIRTLDLDRRIVSRLKPRVNLAKKIADVEVAKTKGQGKDESFLRAAAEELGVDYSSDEEVGGSKGKRGRGAQRIKKEGEMREVSKRDVQAMRAELKALLGKRVNVGVSEKYLTSGGIDVNGLLSKQDNGNGVEFLGHVGDLGL